jgi:RTX calcium-binding nonapeptide repeat (4 copies)
VVARYELYGTAGDNDLNAMVGGNGPPPAFRYGRAGDDQLRGGLGDDRLVGGKGRDTGPGRLGDDTCVSIERAFMGETPACEIRHSRSWTARRR